MYKTEVFYKANYFDKATMVRISDLNSEELDTLNLLAIDIQTLKATYKENLYYCNYQFTPSICYYKFPYCLMLRFNTLISHTENIKDYIEESIFKYINKTDMCLLKKDYRYWLMSLPDGIVFDFINRYTQDIEVLSQDLYDAILEQYTRREYSFSEINPQLLLKLQYSTPENMEKEINRLYGKKELITIYRGEGDKSNPDGYSWTLDLNMAYFFACRLASQAKIKIAEVSKHDVIAYINDRGEKELLIFPENINCIDEKIQYSDREISDRLVDSDYFEIMLYYRNLMDDIDIISQHPDAPHIIRVMLLVTALSYLYELRIEEFEDIVVAALFYDIGGVSDMIDEDHEVITRKMLRENSYGIYIGKTAQVLIEYHYENRKMFEKWLKENIADEIDKERITLMYDILCDANILDEIGLGFQNLKLQQLKLEESMKLVLFAYKASENITE